MPKSLLQEIVFTVLMVLVMVYAMICYNIALNIGGMTNEVFLLAALRLGTRRKEALCPSSQGIQCRHCKNSPQQGRG